MAFRRGRAISSLIIPLIAVLITPATAGRASVLQLADGGDYCEAWKFAVETNSAGTWKTVPEECKGFVAKYVNGEQHSKDYQIVVNYAIDFASTIKPDSDGKDAWVFDIDETLLSNLPYYQAHGYGTEPFDEAKFNAWVEKGKAKAFAASTRLYNYLKNRNFTIILLTGRDEHQRNITEQNLLKAEYSGWERLILRSPAEEGQSATSYKSEQRAKLIKQGYRIHGSTGDQWSDLLGSAMAERSFKAPNPMYYIP